MSDISTSSDSSPTASGDRVQATPGRALVTGLAKLVDGLRQFADEFGLPHARVSACEFEPFKNRATEEVLVSWLRDGRCGAERLQALMTTLADHQLALLAAIDAIAVEAVSQLSPEQHAAGGPLAGFRSGAWRRLCRHHERLVANPNIRHQAIVLPGFVNGYARAREALDQGRSISHRVGEMLPEAKA